MYGSPSKIVTIIAPSGVSNGSADLKKPTSSSTPTDQRIPKVINPEIPHVETHTLVIPDLPVHILGQTPDMRKVEDDPVEATFLDCFPSLLQLRRIHTVQQLSFLFRFKLLDVRCRLRILFYERRATVEAGSYKSAATVCSEQRMAEGEIAYR